MTIRESLNALNLPTVIALTVSIFCTLAPGSLIIYNFNENLFLSLDLFKLLLLSAAITIPGVLTPYLISVAGPLGAKFTAEELQGLDHLAILTKHGANSGLNIYLSLTASYFFDLQFKGFLIMYIVLTVITATSELFSVVIAKYKALSNHSN